MVKLLIHAHLWLAFTILRGLATFVQAAAARLTRFAERFD